jgi:hypothetical protein
MRKAARKWFVCPQAVIIGKQMRIPTKCRFAMAAGIAFLLGALCLALMAISDRLGRDTA